MSENLADLLASWIVAAVILALCVLAGLWLHPEGPTPHIALYVAVLALVNSLRDPRYRR